MIDVTTEQIGEMTANGVKDWLKTVEVCDYPEAAKWLEQDKRAALQTMAKTLRNKWAKHNLAVEKCSAMRCIEKECREQGYAYPCGMDEVGRGPLAGPVVTAAVIMPENSEILYVDDSKKLSQKMREALNEQILQEAVAVAIGLRSPEKIDALNILEATKAAMQESVEALEVKPDLLLIDAVDIKTDIPTRPIIHGDARCYSIAAASIVAKVYRDDLMRQYALQYPEYGFERNMGYGTAEHIAAIKKYGLTPIHRLSFVKNFR